MCARGLSLLQPGLLSPLQLIILRLLSLQLALSRQTPLHLLLVGQSPVGSPGLGRTRMVFVRGELVWVFCSWLNTHYIYIYI